MNKACWALGALALGTFVTMVLVLQLEIRPVAASFDLPQSDFNGYDHGDVQAFSMAIGAEGRAIYRTVLIYPDTVFALTFAMFSVLMQWRSWPLIALLSGGLYALADLGENRLILRVVDQTALCDAVAACPDLPDGTGLASLFTLAKFGLFGVCLGGVWLAWRRERP